MSELELDTPHGPARAHVDALDDARAALVLGHGAGGGVAARDLVAAKQAALAARVAVALVEQPYRVAGRRSPAPAHQLDAAWIAVVEQLLGGELRGLPLIAGGRSAGARVACRTAAATGAAGVLCLAFPLHPPGRPARRQPMTSPPGEAGSRQAELDAVAVPVLVVQGASDPFGMPAGGPGRTIATVKGNHSLSSDVEALRSAVRDWLPQVLP